MYVLLIEGEASVAKVIEEYIEALDHSVETAYTGEDAMKKLREKRFDLMLLDIFLPDCKGHELIPKFKETQPDMGIVTMTGYNTKELELEVRQQGVLYYMVKPFTITEMKEILDHISKKKKANKVSFERAG
ncbi:MAG: response regulator [Deltaproteobacteria bacterium]|nr:response regulator [Deltaproteobacteria bacterium]MBW2078380.1 response regulator [Deltaproteobacteria bacterium]